MRGPDDRGGRDLRTVAHNLRAARTLAGLSLEELGRRARVSKAALAALEKAQSNPAGGSRKRGPTHADHLGRAALTRSGAGNCTRTRPDSPPRSAAKPIMTAHPPPAAGASTT
jgi:hypothetical protein